MYPFTQDTVDLDELRARLRKMSDGDLRLRESGAVYVQPGSEPWTVATGAVCDSANGGQRTRTNDSTQSTLGQATDCTLLGGV
jgi:hypothetical protein